MPSRPLPKYLPKFDFLGTALLAAMLFGLLLGFSYGQRLGWTSYDIISLFAMGIFGGIGFIYRQLTGDAPLVNLRLYFNMQFSAAALIAFFTECAFLTSTILLPLFVQQIQHFTPFHSGLLLVPSGLLMLILFPLSGRLADMMPPQYLVYAGLLCYSLSFALMAGMDVNTPFWTVVWFTLFMRMGSAFTRPVTNATALSSLPTEQLHQGSSALKLYAEAGWCAGRERDDRVPGIAHSLSR